MGTHNMLSFNDRRAIANIFDEVIAEGNLFSTSGTQEGPWKYKDGWSDERIQNLAKEKGITATPSNIAGIRKEVAGNPNPWMT